MLIIIQAYEQIEDGRIGRCVGEYSTRIIENAISWVDDIEQGSFDVHCYVEVDGREMGRDWLMDQEG
jgi:hypothetical protein